MRKTKIIATIGPASQKAEIIEEMVKEGVDVFRLNFAHGTLEEKRRIIRYIREIEEKLSRPVGIIADIPGRGPRIGMLPRGYLSKGEKVIFRFGAKESDHPHVIPVPQKEILDILELGDNILLADGRVIVEITKIIGNEAEGTVISDGEIRSNVSITVKHKPLPFPALSERDKNFIKFSIKNDVDFVALSFVQSADDVKELRDFLDDNNGDLIKIISKIENKPAILNLEKIIQLSDAIMVARGDLGVQISLEDIPYLENLIIRESLKEGKPVILATQVLESMIESPVPTRAEIMDIATAVEKGVDAIMVSGETAIGKYPVEVVRWLRRVIEKVEVFVTSPRYEVSEKSPIYAKFNRGVVYVAEFLGAKIIAFSTRGFTAMMLSRFRPRCDVIIISNSMKTVRQLKVMWGINPIYSEMKKMTLDELKRVAMEKKLINKGEKIVLTLGWREELGPAQDIRVEVVRE